MATEPHFPYIYGPYSESISRGCRWFSDGDIESVPGSHHRAPARLSRPTCTVTVHDASRTVGCTHVTTIALSGWQVSSRRRSRQYQTPNPKKRHFSEQSVATQRHSGHNRRALPPPDDPAPSIAVTGAVQSGPLCEWPMSSATALQVTSATNAIRVAPEFRPVISRGR